MSIPAPPVGFQVNGSAIVGDGRLWRISRERYHEMIDAGFFVENENYELIHGYLVEKMAKNKPHVWVLRLLLTYLLRLISEDSGWFIISQEPIGLSDSEPEPDVAIVRGNVTDYWEFPSGQDLGLAIEVSDSTLRYDRDIKRPLFAEEGVVQYWIVDVNARTIEAYSEPFVAGNVADYASKVVYQDGDEIAVVLDGVDFGRIPLTQILPPLDKQIRV